MMVRRGVDDKVDARLLQQFVIIDVCLSVGRVLLRHFDILVLHIADGNALRSQTKEALGHIPSAIARPDQAKSWAVICTPN